MGKAIDVKEVEKSVRVGVFALRKHMTETEVRRFLEATLNEARRG